MTARLQTVADNIENNLKPELQALAQAAVADVKEKIAEAKEEKNSTEDTAPAETDE